MSEPSGRSSPRRVLVALEAGAEAPALLEAAANLAAGLEAELVGLFVEDSDLLEAADLRVTHAVPALAQDQGQAPMDTRLMQRALRISAGKLEAALAAAAERRRIKWSYRVVRGHMEEQVLAEVQSRDLLALGVPARLVRRTQIAVVSRTVAERAPCSVLLMQAAAGLDRPVTVVYDGSERTLALGERMARIYGRPLNVLAVGETEQAALDLEKQAFDWLHSRGVRARLRARAVDEAEEICAAMRSEQPGTLVLDPEGGLVRKLGLEAVLSGLKCSVLVLR